ncbi:SRPBCC family protein [Anaerobacillus sp. 1_MG-2023]|uniref:SRPBCC family protein n=1 Tax=Bacillales TaxID=1385 RepID=UPI0026E23439|nr:SRPBCC family protein [Anaerobacillus sp. 1_MG-2023]MDO6657233.1 SRPBCC family protein [Anaerobacillus sp. 1_MG-2023]
MPVIYLETLIEAPIEICFNYARSVEAHMKSTEQTNEKAVRGVTEGLLGNGDAVTWEATHFGIKQKLTAKITGMQEPDWFIDEMTKGAFKSFVHSHRFEEIDDVTLMIDEFSYEAPFGLIGSIANLLFLKKYMKNLLEKRALELKKMAERTE